MHLSSLRALGVPAVLVLALVLANPSLGFGAADLVVTSITNPPTDALPGDSFVVTATVKNNVVVAPSNPVTAPSTAKFSLISTTSLFKKNLKGVQNVPGLAAQASDTTGVTVEVFSDTPPGTYRVEACADATSVVPEGAFEENNCRLSTGAIIVHDVPDLAVTAISGLPPSLPQGQTFSVTTTVVNTGGVKALASTVKYYLCTPAPTGPGCLPPPDVAKIDLKNLQTIPKIPPGGTFTNLHTLEVRAETVVGSYRMQGCADSGKDITEDNENNNCLTLPALVQVTPQPDLVVKSVTVAGPFPLTIDAGDELVITTVVKNEGQTDAGASTIKFVLVDTTDPGAPKKNLKDRPLVNALPPGKKQVVQAIVRTYGDTPGGTYTFQACADSGKGVGESEESNNCIDAPSTMKVIVIGLPLSDAELAVNAVTNPQATAVPGDPIEVTATVKNKGTAPSPATTNRFYLVSGTGPTATRKNLKGFQAVPGLPADATSAVPATVEIYSDTVPGSYFLEACADGDEQVLEDNENNNCRISPGQVTVQEIPNLVVTTIDNPPAALLQGQSFQAKETVMNVGLVTAPASTVKYYLCTPSPTGCLPAASGGTKIDLKGTQAVPQLLAGQTFSETQGVKVRAETLPGSYALQACADSGKFVPEPNEEDNCLTSAGTVQVTALADLVVTRVTVESTPVTVALGATFMVTSVVKNTALGDAGPSMTKFYLIVTPGAAQKRDLNGTQAVPALTHGTKSQAQKAVGVEDDTPLGAYYVLACADSGKTVLENDEGNNCTTSAETVTVVP